jgi:beta-1,4-mannosyl-glycoprotein beta-1,4-N-acetylglucosaminyltransferase
MKAIDTFCFNGEFVVPLRLKYLYPVMDAFVIVESKYTHSGEEKPELFKDKYAEWFEPYASKIHWVVIEKFPEMTDEWFKMYKIHDWMKTHHTSWFREAYQRDMAGEYILKTFGSTGYYVHVSDADEIPADFLFQSHLRETIYKHLREHQAPIYLEMDFYYYNFHWKKKQKWYRSYLIQGELIRHNTPLTYWRIHNPVHYSIAAAGWHFSYFMSVPDLQRKLKSFAHRECDQDSWKTTQHIKECLKTGKDLFERGDAEDLEPTPMECYQGFPGLFSPWILDLDILQEVKGF